jgi:hypothetical protein
MQLSFKQMTQDKVVNKILFTLRQQRILDEYTSAFARPLLQQLYVVGWEEGRKSDNYHSNDKPVVQYDKQGKKIADYPSVTSAANKLHCTRDGIYKAISKGTPTKKGHVWKYLTSSTES